MAVPPHQAYEETARRKSKKQYLTLVAFTNKWNTHGFFERWRGIQTPTAYSKEATECLRINYFPETEITISKPLFFPKRGERERKQWNRWCFKCNQD